MNLKMTEKKTRLLCEDDVIKAVDKHTNDDGILDDDITCILEEVEDYRDQVACTTDSKLPKTNCDVPMPPVKPVMSVMPESKLSLSCPKVFMFKADLPIENSIRIQEILKSQITDGCLVIPDCIEFIGIEEPLVVLP